MTPRRWLSVPIVLLALVVAAIGVRFIFLEREIKGALGDDLQGPLEVARVEIEAWRDRLALRARVAAELVATGVEFDRVAPSVIGSDSATLWLATMGGKVTRTHGPLATSIPALVDRYERRFVTTQCGDGYCTDARVPIVLASGDSLIVGIRVPLGDGTFRHLDSPRHIPSSRASLLTRRGDSVIVLATAAHDTIPLTRRALAWSAAPAHVQRAFGTARTAGAAAGQGLVHEKVLFGTARDTLMNWVLVREIEGYALFEQFLSRVLIDVLFVGALILFALAYIRSRLRIVGMRRDQELASMRANFVSAVSHELRTPLAQITLFADLLRNGSLRGPSENERALNVIEKEAGRLAILVDNVLNHARLTRGGKKPAGAGTHETDVARDVAYVIDAFGPLAAEKDVRVMSTVPEGLTAAVDSQSLRQILLNFVENAVKYGPEGQSVTLGSEETTDRVRISVSDEGPGVPIGERETIWQPFERGASGHLSRAGGSGIGLSVVRDLAEQYGGKAWVESGPKNGARFVVEFARTAESASRRIAS